MGTNRSQAPANEHSSRTLPRLIGVIILALVAATYIILPDRQHRDDILQYSMAAETGERLFVPNHLLYPPLIRAGWLMQSRIDPAVRALDTANMINLAFGLLTVTLFYLFNARLTGNYITSALYTLGFAFAYDTWSYSSSGEAYIIPLCCMLLGYNVLLNKTEISSRTALVIGLLVAVAALIHQSYVLLLVPFVLYIVTRFRDFKSTLLLCVISGTVCVSIYAWVAFTTQPVSSISELISWSRGHIGNPTFGRFYGLDSLRDAIIGFTNSLIDLKRTRNVIFIRGEVSTALPSFLAMGGLAIIGIGLAVGAIRAIASLRINDDRTRPWLRLLLFHLLFFSLVASYWSPSDHKFWAPVVFPLFTLFHLGTLYGSSGWRRTALATATGLIMAFWCFNAFLGVHRLEQTNEYQTAQKIVESVPENAFVLIPDSHVWRYAEYFFADKPVTFNSLYNTDGSEKFKADLIAGIRTAFSTGNLFITEDEIRPSRWRTSPFAFLNQDDYTRFYNDIIDATVPVTEFTAFGNQYQLYKVTHLRE